MSTTKMINCYVLDGRLLVSDSMEDLRAATPAERAASYAERSGTGRIEVDVPLRTLRRRAPGYVQTHNAIVDAMGGERL